MASTVMSRSQFVGIAVSGASSVATPTAKAPLRVVAAKAAPKKGGGKAVKSWGGGDNDLALEKWYGPDRRLFLPSGFLDRDDVPEYLNGEVPGDYGYDPLGLGEDPEKFEKYRANELIHARWAMLGAAGAFIPEALNSYAPGDFGGSPDAAIWWKTGAQLLDPAGRVSWFGISIPLPLVAAIVLEVVLVGGAEFFRSRNESPLENFSDFEDTLHPGGVFDPFGLASDPEIAAELKVKEIKNGRLAMISFLGFAVQAAVTGEGPYANWSKHVADPFGYNLLTIIGSGGDRVPTL